MLLAWLPPSPTYGSKVVWKEQIENVPTMSTIYLVRHGQKMPHAGDPSLTQLGKQQALETGRYLQQFKIDLILASPYKRTVETAQIISKELNQGFNISPALAERMNWDEDDVTKHDFLAEWNKATLNRDYRPQSGDSSRSTGKRIQELIKNVGLDDVSLLLVTHGGAIIDYLRNVFGDGAVEAVKIKYFDLEDYQMLSCAINKVVLADPPRLEILNFSDHLSDAEE